MRRTTIRFATGTRPRQARPVLQRKCACGQHAGGGECEECKKKPDEKSSRDPLLQRSSVNGAAGNGRGLHDGGESQAPAIVHDVLRSSGRPLDAATRAFFEPRFGQNFSQVRVHDGPPAAASAQAVGAVAYAVGSNLVFANGKYDPASSSGKKLLAHELTHVQQQGSTSASWQSNPAALQVGQPDDAFELEASRNEMMAERNSVLEKSPGEARSAGEFERCPNRVAVPRVQRDLDDPSRFATIHDALFVTTSGGGTPQPWKDPAPGEEGTAEKIKKEFKTKFLDWLKDHPMATGGYVPTETTKDDADTDVVSADKIIRAKFPQISAAIPESKLKDAVSVMTDQDASDPDFVTQFLTNRMNGFGVLHYAIHETDPRFQKMLDEILADGEIGPKIKILASRSSANTSGEGASRKVALNRGLDDKRRKETLLHELVHFYVHPTFKDWINQSTEPRKYDEGFTEYVSRLAMTKDQLADAKGYPDSFDFVKTKIAANASDDDIARAYFSGEVWLLEGKTDVSKKALEITGLKSKVTPKQEREESKTSDGIAETVAPGSHYRFMNLGNEEAEPKREHQALFAEIQKTYLSAHPDVGCRFVGHASSPGTDAFNTALSLKRAQAFYQMARDAGVPDSQLVDANKPPHFGERKPTAPNEDVRGRAFNRRVELFLVPSQPASGAGAVQQAPAPNGQLSNYRTNVQLRDVLQSPGQPLDSATRAQFEERFARDFSHVRIHADAQAAESVRGMNALAYATGSHVAFGAGQYDSKTLRGKQLLAHELTHVAQQSLSQTGDAWASQRAERQAAENARRFPGSGFLPSLEAAPRTAIMRQDRGGAGTQTQTRDDELALGDKLVKDFPSGVNVAFYADPEPAEAQRRAADWATREDAIGPKKSAISAKELAFGKAISDTLGLASTLKSMATVLSAAVKKSLAASGTVLPELWPAKVRNLALFSHGTSGWCGLGTGITSSNAKSIVKTIAPTLASDVNVLLFACNTGRAPSEDEDWVKGTTEAGGAGSLASVTRDALADEGLSSGTVWGHTTTGHVSGNPALREFSADDGKGQPGSAYLTKYVFTGPQQAAALVKLQEALVTKGFSAADPKEFDAAARQEITALMYACYVEANGKLDFKGGKLAESAPTHPTEVADLINKYWTTYWPDHMDKAADKLAKRLGLKKEKK
jgi:outer membrane protein OmpA-like peptidoglycan-associated protein